MGMWRAIAHYTHMASAAAIPVWLLALLFEAVLWRTLPWNETLGFGVVPGFLYVISFMIVYLYFMCVAVEDEN